MRLSRTPPFSMILAATAPLLLAIFFAINQSSNRIEETVSENLKALTKSKKQQVESYFEVIRDQASTMSQSTMVKRAMQGFSWSFFMLPNRKGDNIPALDEQRSVVKKYYAEQFGARYKAENGADIDIEALMPASDAVISAQYWYIGANPHPLGSKDALDAPVGNKGRYSNQHKTYHPVLRNFLQTFGYYDIFLVEPKTGHIVYSVFKELDYGTSLLTGPYKDTNFGKAFRMALQATEPGSTYLVDFDRYTPSYDAPASFISAPIFDGKDLAGVLIFQMPVERINAIMQKSDGLGETGETYLVGDDKKLRSQSRFTDVNTILEREAKGEGVLLSIKGESGFERTENAEGDAVATAYEPVQIPGVSWGIVTKMADGEAFAAITSVRWAGVQVAIFAVLAILAYTIYFTRGLSNRVREVLGVANSIKDGNFDNTIDTSVSDEIGDLQCALKEMQQALASHDSERISALRITQALRSANTNVMVADADGIVVFVNEAMRKLLQACESDLRSAASDFSVDNVVGAPAATWLDAGSSTDIGARRFGNRYFYVGSAEIRNEAGEHQGQVYEISDLTERINAESQIAGLLRDATAGKLETRLDTHDWEGFRREMGEGVNNLMDAITEPIAVTGNYLQRISRGDIPEKCSADFAGDFGLMRDNLNTSIDAINRLVQDVDQLSASAVAGRLADRADRSRHEGRFQDIVDGLNHTLDAIVAPVEEVRTVLESVANNVLTEQMQGNYQGDFAQLRASVNASIGNLGEMVNEIVRSADRIAMSSAEISEGNMNLSTRTEQQCTSLEEMGNSMRELTDTVNQNADNAQKASELSSTAREQANSGGQVVEQAIDAMSEIEQSSRRISEIITVIDEIAFQTNLLALNAAVEAARAGDQGRGFAVVATEVRQLAQRSAVAAKEIKDLIKESVDRVNTGSELVRKSGETLTEINKSINEASTLVGDIATASAQQRDGIGSVNSAVGQIDNATQQNAALGEEVAAASATLATEADSLRELTQRFTVDRSFANDADMDAGSERSANAGPGRHASAGSGTAQVIPGPGYPKDAARDKMRGALAAG